MDWDGHTEEITLPDGWLREQFDQMQEQSAAIKRLTDSLYAHRHYGMSMGPVEVNPKDLELALTLLKLVTG